MALDEKKRQQKLAKKWAKRKTKLAGKRPSTGGGSSPTQAAHFPIHDCLVGKELFGVGIGNVILSRSLPNGDLATAAFLIDVYCLGVKNAFYSVTPAQDYAFNLQQIEASAGRLERAAQEVVTDFFALNVGLRRVNMILPHRLDPG